VSSRVPDLELICFCSYRNSDSRVAPLAMGTAETLDSYLHSLPERSNKNRLAYLYSDFSRGDNPAGARGNVEWWKTTLSQIVARGLQSGGGEGNSSSADKLVLCADQGLLERLRIEGVGRPMAIGYVLVRNSYSNFLGEQ
jgi:hypothetical protein